MNPDKISNATRELKQPLNWDTDKHGECSPLWVRITEDDLYQSAWKPTADELAFLNQGGQVIASVVGFQPALMLNVELTLDANVARIQELERETARLRHALRGGDALKDNAEIIEFLSDRLVHVHGENENLDYLRAARQRAHMLRGALYSMPKSEGAK